MLLLEDRKIELVCSECGYGIVSVTVPEACPMCHGTTWDRPAWRPFTGLAGFRPTAARDEDRPLRGSV
jgi:hypothetical protein